MKNLNDLKNLIPAGLVGGSAASAGEGTATRKKHPVLLILAAAAVLVILIALLAGGGRKTVDMKDYITVSFSGLDEKGEASLDLDYNALSEFINGGEYDAEDLSNWAEILTREAKLYDAFEYAVAPARELANGDRVTVEVLADKELCKELGIKVKGEKFTCTVEGLVTVKAIDAFADITVEFSGISPYGTARIVNKSMDSACMSYQYSLDKNSDLAIGDVVTVSISEGNLERVAEQTGKAPAELKKQYTVTGLSSYVTRLEQISDELLKKMQKECEDYFTANALRSWREENTLKSMEYVGACLQIKKPGSFWSGMENLLVLVYKNVCLNTSVEEEPLEVTYYTYVRFQELMLDEAGQVEVDLSDYSAANNYYSFRAPDGWGCYVYGYETVAELFSDCVTRYVDEYTYESSFGV